MIRKVCSLALIPSTPELSTLLILLITIHTNQIIQSYLRSSITQQRLNGLALVLIESEEARKIDKKKLSIILQTKNAWHFLKF